MPLVLIARHYSRVKSELLSMISWSCGTLRWQLAVEGSSARSRRVSLLLSSILFTGAWGGPGFANVSKCSEGPLTWQCGAKFSGTADHPATRVLGGSLYLHSPAPCLKARDSCCAELWNRMQGTSIRPMRRVQLSGIRVRVELGNLLKLTRHPQTCISARAPQTPWNSSISQRGELIMAWWQCHLCTASLTDRMPSNSR